MFKKTILHLFLLGVISSLSAGNHLQKSPFFIESVYNAIKNGELYKIKQYLLNIENINIINREPTYFLKVALIAFAENTSEDKTEMYRDIIEYLLTRKAEIVYRSPEPWIRDYPLLTVIRYDMRNILELFIKYKYDIIQLAPEHGTSLNQALEYKQQNLYNYLQQLTLQTT